MKNFNKNTGITLIALVVSIVVLLILAGVTINALFGSNGIISGSTKAKEEYSKSEAKEKVSLLLNEYAIKNTTDEKIDFAKFLRQSLQVGVAENDNNTYSFLLGEWQITTDESKIISIEKFNINVDKTYTSVESMKSDTELTEGKLVQTEGYYDKCYGGGAYYDIVSATNLTVDSANCIQLNNGLYAKLHAVNDTVTVNQFGTYGDGEHDDASAIQLALNSGYSNVCFESEKYKFSKNIKLSTDNTHVIGNNATLFWDEKVEFKTWEQFYIMGSSTSHVNNIEICNLNFENYNVKGVESVQLLMWYCDNICINNCNFNIERIEGNTERKITNIWLYNEFSNITIQQCKFRNLTEGEVGGNIWITGSNDNYICNNLKIENNYIEKSCCDESIAIWGRYS